MQWSVTKVSIIFRLSRKVLSSKASPLRQKRISSRIFFGIQYERRSPVPPSCRIFFRSANAFRTRPTPVTVAITTGFSVIPPATAALIINLPVERLRRKFLRRNPQ